MRPILSIASFRNRRSLGKFLNSRGLIGQAVEIGTHRGDFADTLLRTWKGFLHCVDPWKAVAGYEDQAQGLAHLWRTDGDRSKDMKYTAKRLWGYSKRFKLHPVCSVEAAREFADQVLDFVYIDGDHRREMVDLDLRVWFGKLKPGGLLAGHDFFCPNEANGGWGRDIQAAVIPFAMEHDLTIQLIAEEDNSPWSFYMEKPK